MQELSPVGNGRYGNGGLRVVLHMLKCSQGIMMVLYFIGEYLFNTPARQLATLCEK